MEDRQRDVLRRRVGLDLGLGADRHLFAAAHGLARAHLAAIQAGLAGLDPARQAGARVLREQFGEHRVEAASGRAVGDGGAQLDGFDLHGQGIQGRGVRDCYYPPFVPRRPRPTP